MRPIMLFVIGECMMFGAIPTVFFLPWPFKWIGWTFLFTYGLIFCLYYQFVLLKKKVLEE